MSVALDGPGVMARAIRAQSVRAARSQCGRNCRFAQSDGLSISRYADYQQFFHVGLDCGMNFGNPGETWRQSLVARPVHPSG